MQINPEDAAAPGIAEGEWVRVESRRGAIEAPARLGDIPRGRLFVPFHYGYWDDPGRARAAIELTLFEWDAVSKQPHYKFLAVKIARVDRPSTPQPDEQVTKATTWTDAARHAAGAAKELVRPTRAHVIDYLGMAIQSEEALLSMLEKVAVAHIKDAGVHSMTVRLAAWTRGHLPPLRETAGRLGERTRSQPRRLASALDPGLRPTGFGLVRDLRDCWTMANETHVYLRVLHQAALAQRDEQLNHAVEKTDHNNRRQREWLFTKIMEAAPQALVVPE